MFSHRHLLTLQDDDDLEDVNENIKNYDSDDEYLYNDEKSNYELITTKRGTKLALLRYSKYFYLLVKSIFL